MPQRVTLAQLLIEHGLGPRQAHRVVTQLAETLLDPADTRSPVPVHFPAVPDAAAVQCRLAELQVEATPFVPAEADARAVRAATGLTQEEFARRFGLDVATLRNWEQGRTRPDGPARVLLRVILRQPQAVEAALML